MIGASLGVIGRLTVSFFWYSGRLVGHSENEAGTAAFALAVRFWWTALCSDIVSDPGGPNRCSGEGGTGSKMPNSA
jgi:hypothetical protein